MNNASIIATVHSTDPPAEMLQEARDATAAAGFTDAEVTREKETSVKIGTGKVSLVLFDDHQEPDEPRITISFAEFLHPPNWDDSAAHHEFLDNSLELLRQLAVRFDAAYLPVFDRHCWSDIVPDGVPIADHIDQPPTLGIYSASLLDDLGGIDRLYDRQPWRTIDLANGRVAVFDTDSPWGNSCWTEHTFDDLGIAADDSQ